MSSLTVTEKSAEELLAKAKAEQHAAQMRKAQADAALETLREQLQDAVAKIKSLGYNSPKEAQEAAVTMREEASTALTEALAKLQGVS